MSTKRADLSLTRRGLLRLGGAAAASPALLPFLPLLESDAEAAGFPKRILLFFIPIGTRYKEWSPTGTETNFTLGRVLAPLEKYKSKITVLDGMDNIAVVGGPAPQGHPSVNCLYTGAPHAFDRTVSGNGGTFGWPTGPSVDQFVADEIAKVAPTPVSSIETGVSDGGGYRTRISFKGANQPVPPLIDPAVVYAKLFGDLKIDPARLAALLAARRSVIDTIKGDLGRMKARIPAVDRPKVEAHLTNIRAIEAKVSVPTGSCDRIPPIPGTPMKVIGTSGQPAQIDAFGSLITAAFSCNLTRVATIVTGAEEGGVGHSTFIDLGTTTTDPHHIISHRSDPAGYEALIRISIWYYDQMRILMDKLSAIPEGNGTMLDNTVIVSASPMGDPNYHSPRGAPVVLGGSCGGALKTGRLLKFGNFAPAKESRRDYGGQPMNNLLMSLCHAMGFPVSSFGDKRYSTGTVPGLLA